MAKAIAKDPVPDEFAERFPAMPKAMFTVSVAEESAVRGAAMARARFMTTEPIPESAWTEAPIRRARSMATGPMTESAVGVDWRAQAAASEGVRSESETTEASRSTATTGTSEGVGGKNPSMLTAR